VSAIPEITRELNLELATATFNETFTRNSDLVTCWGLVDLGTSTVQIQAPVTYRYHLCLREPWHLELKQGCLVVKAPVIQPSLPPAIHTDQLTTLAVRGWGRGSTGELLTALQQSLTPTLNQYAGDDHRKTRQNSNQRLNSAWFGETARIKSRAFSVAMDKLAVWN
jgi:hypothetical protein